MIVPTGAAFEGVDAAIDRVTVQLGLVAPQIVRITRRDEAIDHMRADVFRDASAIVMPGESSLHIRSVMKDTPLWQSIVDAWMGGAALIATGGASAMVGDPMLDARGGAFTLGMGLVASTAFVPDADTLSDDRMKRTRKLVSKGVALVEIASTASLVWQHETGWVAHGTVSVQRDHAPVALGALNVPA